MANAPTPAYNCPFCHISILGNPIIPPEHHCPTYVGLVLSPGDLIIIKHLTVLQFKFQELLQGLKKT